LSPLMVPEEITKWLAATDCHIVVTLDLLAPSVMPALTNGPLEHVIVASLAGRMKPWRGWLYRIERLRRNGLTLRGNGRVHEFENVARGSSQNLSSRIVPEEDIALMSPTGGTTASPKAVMLTHRNLLCNAFQLGA